MDGEKEIAEERIRKLLELAGDRYREGDKELSDRYVKLAREIGMSYNVPIPSNLKKFICGSCNSYLIPGRNCTVRIDSKRQNIKYICENCGNVSQHGF